MVHASWPFIKVIESGDRGSVIIFSLVAEFWDFFGNGKTKDNLIHSKKFEVFFNGPESVMFWINLFSFHCCRLWWHWSGYSFNVFRYCLYRFLFCMVIYFFGLLVILRRYTRLPNISSIINVLTCIVLLSLCIVILMWKPFFFNFHWLCVQV